MMPQQTPTDRRVVFTHCSESTVAGHASSCEVGSPLIYAWLT